MSTVITIPLSDNEELAALVADKQPGDKLYACGTIKALDAQTLTLRVEEVTDKKDDLPDPETDEDDEDENESEDGSIEEEAGNGSSPDEVDLAKKMASPGYDGP